jgi:hypothetical protein
MIASFDVGERNLAFCIGDEARLVRWRRADVVDATRKRPQTIAESCEAISAVLASAGDWWTQCATVLIELQIRANVRAQRVSQHLWTWFRCTYPTLDVRYVCASLKTQTFVGKNELTPAQRKRWSTEYVEELLRTRGDITHLAYARAQPKRDDLCDAYAQLLAYCAAEEKKRATRAVPTSEPRKRRASGPMAAAT